DLNAFDSILTNIVENSVKYSPPNSTINISLTNANNSFILTIADTGKGITDENKSKIFNKFFREQNELTRQTQGTGLGLYIVNYLVKKHNGIIKLKDNQPKGLVVEIKIPKQ
ncbi:MAG TPA: ATP-binding protein, partial [Crocinitomix sp.]|nr:ATP-binding protein [Crocinitomix sp.]